MMSKDTLQIVACTLRKTRGEPLITVRPHNVSIRIYERRITEEVKKQQVWKSTQRLSEESC